MAGGTKPTRPHEQHDCNFEASFWTQGRLLLGAGGNMFMNRKKKSKLSIKFLFVKKCNFIA